MTHCLLTLDKLFITHCLEWNIKTLLRTFFRIPFFLSIEIEILSIEKEFKFFFKYRKRFSILKNYFRSAILF